eukprot:10811012-Heterocapsa_arctica.AAC.1
MSIVREGDGHLAQELAELVERDRLLNDLFKQAFVFIACAERHHQLQGVHLLAAFRERGFVGRATEAVVLL